MEKKIRLKKEDIEKAERDFLEVIKDNSYAIHLKEHKIKNSEIRYNGISSGLNLTPLNPDMENEKFYGAIYTYGGITTPHEVEGIRPTLTQQYNDNGITLLGWKNSVFENFDDFLKSGCVHLYVRPKEVLTSDEQILMIIKFISHTESNIKLFVGMELFREESNVIGAHNIAILADRPDVLQIDFFFIPSPSNTTSKTLVTFIGADIFAI